jgi:hypothetical protein
MRRIFALAMLALAVSAHAQPVFIPPQYMPQLDGVPNWFQYRLAFRDEFNSLDVAGGLGWGDSASYHRWACHTPGSTDFGDAYFSGPQDGKAPDGVSYMSPFSVDGNGILSITAWIDPTINHWRSGLLSSIDYTGKGFSVVGVGSYFECRMKCPVAKDAAGNPIPGLWPAFWLETVPGAYHNNYGNWNASTEIDVAEIYSIDYTKLHCNVHLWNTFDDSRGGGATIDVPDLSADFHTYGVLIQSDVMTFYFDNKKAWQCPTPVEAYQPMYLMVDLALGGGWDSSKVPNPSSMQVDYIRCWHLPVQPGQ